MTHRSRVCHFVIDVDDLDQGIEFWAATLDAKEEPLPETSRPVYRRLRLPDSDIRILLQLTDDPKTAKERMHLELETDNIEAEVRRLEALGATRWNHQQERGYDFWVLRDPWGNEFCLLDVNFPELLSQRPLERQLVSDGKTGRLRRFAGSGPPAPWSTPSTLSVWPAGPVSAGPAAPG